MGNRKKRLLSGLLAAVLLAGSLSSCVSRTGGGEQGGDSERVADSADTEAPKRRGDTGLAAVTGHVNLATTHQLLLARPTGDISVGSDHYYITGCSDPALPLYLNGAELLEDRGVYGSFGVYAQLEDGENVFTFTQEGVSETVVITKEEQPLYTTSQLTDLFPSVDSAVRSGAEVTISCTGPAGGAVTAEIQGQAVLLDQSGDGAVSGAPVSFSGTFVPEEVSGTLELGQVTYHLDWDGAQKQFKSDGILFAAGSGDVLLVQAKDIASAVFTEADDESEFFTLLPGGAVDTVEEIRGSMYRLGMGGYVLKSMVQPLTDDIAYRSSVSGTAYSLGDGLERLRLTGTATPPYRMEREDGLLRLTLFHTGGIGEVDVGESRLFQDVTVSSQGEDSVLEFTLGGEESPWGQLVEYEGTDTVVTFLYAPRLSENREVPLDGVNILLDAGHGGTDDGASGVPLDNGPKEKEITLATTFAVGSYLEAMGATVRYTREGDEYLSLTQRLELTQRPGVDFMVSLHCNSIPVNANGTEPSGVEIYYYDSISQDFAQTLLDNICAATGRRDRSIRNDYYKVTLNGNVPSVLVEMGFLTNPVEYDSLCNPDEIYLVAQAICDSLIETLSPQPEPEEDQVEQPEE